MIKQLITATVLAASLGLASASGPARADAPEEFTANVTHSDEVNPCTQQTLDVDIVFTVRLHVHNKNQLFVIDTTATTSEGHLATGHETQVITANGQLRTTFNIINEHPTTGEKFSVNGHIRLDTATGQMFQETFRTRCIRPGA